MKKTKLSILAFVASVSFGIFIYWISGSEFERCGEMAAAVAVSVGFGAVFSVMAHI